MNRQAKIVATIGPASADEQTLKRLLQEGMNVARLNFSHGSQAEYRDLILRLRHISESSQRPVAILQDLQGPKIRIGALATAEVALIPGQSFILTTETMTGDAHKASIDYADITRQVRPGSSILLDDGAIELVVHAVTGTEIETRVITGGGLKARKGVNLPGAHLQLPILTAKDHQDLVFGLAHGVDAIAISFVRSAADVISVRKAIAGLAPERKDLPIIAKLERPEALAQLDEILQAADGVMVARGDLGVEMSPAEVPIAQKRIIAAANHHGKLVITATQMLDSMMRNPRPTRAEAADVANAILDGSDAVMLSGETASGKYPIKAVQMMDAIVRQAELHQAQWGQVVKAATGAAATDDAISITRASHELARDRDVSAIVVFTRTGRTAQLMAKTRPQVPILAFTPDAQTFQRLNLFWGVQPLRAPDADSVEAMLAHVDATLLATQHLAPGTQVVVIAGFPVGQTRLPNFALLHTLGA